MEYLNVQFRPKLTYGANSGPEKGGLISASGKGNWHVQLPDLRDAWMRSKRSATTLYGKALHCTEEPG
jgi:hypothetical protein